MKYIDIHSHLNFPDFSGDLEEVIASMKEKGVGTIVVGTTYATSVRAVELAEKYENIWAIVGLHPIHACGEEGEEFNIEEYRKLAQHPRVVGIGECGYDYFHHDVAAHPEYWELQNKAFKAQIALANEVKKPLMLHLRNAKAMSEGAPAKNAYDDALAVLKSEAKVHGNAHFYAGTWEQAEQFFGIGYTISFTGVVTFVREYDEIIRKAPLDRIMCETDAPFVAPVPYRGKRNQPDYVIHTANRIADIKGQPVEGVCETLLANAKRVWGL